MGRATAGTLLDDAIYPNGVTTAYVYDNLNRLTNLAATHVPSSTPITNFGYQYDAAGNRTQKSTLDYTEDYKYDPLQRLTRADRTNPGATPPNQWTWNYDAVGNRTSAQKDSEAATSTHNEKNQLLNTTGGGKMLWRGTLDEPGTASFSAATINGQPARMLAGNVFEATLDLPAGANNVTIQAQDGSGNVATKVYSVNVIGVPSSRTYDANGNLAAKTEGADSWTYTWNALNQLTAVTKNAVAVAAYSYDPNARRVVRADGAASTAFLYDGLDIIRQSLGGSETVFVHGPGFDVPLAREGEPGGTQYLHADILGSIVRESSALGTPSEARHFDAFGATDLSHSSGYGFTGREHDASTGLDYYRQRYYDPKIGRFISQDPIGFIGGLNFYAYVSNDPVNRIDPLGLKGARAPLPIKQCGPLPKDMFGSQNANAWLCCKDGQPAMCVNSEKWAKQTPKRRFCTAVHEAQHADNYEARSGCGGCTARGCEGAPTAPWEQYRREHCWIYLTDYLCYTGSGEQDEKGRDLETVYQRAIDGCRRQGNYGGN